MTDTISHMRVKQEESSYQVLSVRLYFFPDHSRCKGELDAHWMLDKASSAKFQNFLELQIPKPSDYVKISPF